MRDHDGPDEHSRAGRLLEDEACVLDEAQVPQAQFVQKFLLHQARQGLADEAPGVVRAPRAVVPGAVGVGPELDLQEALGFRRNEPAARSASANRGAPDARKGCGVLVVGAGQGHDGPGSPQIAGQVPGQMCPSRDAQCHVRRAQAQSPDGPGVLAAVSGVEYQAATPQRSLGYGMEGECALRVPLCSGRSASAPTSSARLLRRRCAGCIPAEPGRVTSSLWGT